MFLEINDASNGYFFQITSNSAYGFFLIGVRKFKFFQISSCHLLTASFNLRNKSDFKV